jgi:hypothetical protein
MMFISELGGSFMLIFLTLNPAKSFLNPPGKIASGVINKKSREAYSLPA